MARQGVIDISTDNNSDFRCQNLVNVVRVSVWVVVLKSLVLSTDLGLPSSVFRLTRTK